MMAEKENSECILLITLQIETFAQVIFPFVKLFKIQQDSSQKDLLTFNLSLIYLEERDLSDVFCKQWNSNRSWYSGFRN